MMEYISAISYFLTNEVRLFLGLFLVAKVMNFLPKKMLLLLSAEKTNPLLQNAL